jgi:hypothetical protein
MREKNRSASSQPRYDFKRWLLSEAIFWQTPTLKAKKSNLLAL